jgi:hypothetical protein
MAHRSKLSTLLGIFETRSTILAAAVYSFIAIEAFAVMTASRTLRIAAVRSADKGQHSIIVSANCFAEARNFSYRCGWSAFGA